MRINLTKILVLTLIIQLVVGPVAYAQNSAPEKLESIGNFFTSFFDLDNSTNYLRDTFVQNQCRKRDIFAIHEQKNALADTLLDDYQTLTSEQIQSIQTQYAVLTGELTYVRNIGDLTNEELAQKVLGKIRPKIAKYRDDIAEEIPSWHDKYEGRMLEYIDCRSSWQEVKDQVKDIKKSSKQIGSNWSDFKEQFNKTGQELLDTPGAAYGNARDSVSNTFNSIPDQFRKSLDNIEQEANRLLEDVTRDEVDTESSYSEIVDEELSGIESQQSLADILERERQLTVIPEILREQQERSTIDQQIALDYAATRLEQMHSDSAAYILWNDALQLNYNIQKGNSTMNNDQDGIIILSDNLGSRQCSL